MRIWTLALLCTVCSTMLPAQTRADEFAQSSYYYPNKDKPGNSEQQLIVDGLPETDKKFVFEAFALLNKYIAGKRNLIAAMRTNTGIDSQIIGFKQAAQSALAKLSLMQPNSSDTCEHLKNDLAASISEQMQFFDNAQNEIASGKSYEELLKSSEARTNSVRISGIWNLMLNKYDKMSEATKKALLQRLTEFGLNDLSLPS